MLLQSNDWIRLKLNALWAMADNSITSDVSGDITGPSTNAISLFYTVIARDKTIYIQYLGCYKHCHLVLESVHTLMFILSSIKFINFRALHTAL